MIDINRVISKLKKDVVGLENNHYILLKSFKKDRWLKIVNTNQNLCVIENGFKQMQFNFELNQSKECLKLLKQLVDFEFPRSNKIWYSVGELKDGE